MKDSKQQQPPASFLSPRLISLLSTAAVLLICLSFFGEFRIKNTSLIIILQDWHLLFDLNAGLIAKALASIVILGLFAFWEHRRTNGIVFRKSLRSDTLRTVAGFGIICVLLFTLLPQSYTFFLQLQPAVAVLLFLLISWILFLLLIGRRASSVPAPLRSADFLLKRLSTKRFDATIFAVGFSLLVLVKYIYLGWIPLVSDNISQIAQLKLILSGCWYIENPPPVEGMVMFPNGIEGWKAYSVYPPGYMLALFPFYVMGALNLVAPLIGASVLLLVRSVGEMIGGRSAGRLAALLMLTSPFWIIMSAEGMNHSFILMLLLILIRAAIHMYRKDSLLWPLIAGICLSWIGITRPFNAAVYGVGVGIVVLSMRPVRKLLSASVIIALTGIPFAAILCFYNFKTTGSPFTMAYQQFEAIPVRVGFDFMGVPGFTLSAAVQHFYLAVISFSKWFVGWPVFGLLPLMFWWMRGGKSRLEWALAAVMLGQVLAYFCYNYYDQFIGPRFWYEITGPAMILSACALSPLIGHAQSGAAGKTPAIHPPSTIRLGAILILVFFSLYGFFYSMHPKLRSFQVVASHGVVLKRSLEHAPFENSILILPQYYQDWAWLWGPKFEGQYYFIRDRFEEENQRLKRQYPDRRFFKFNSATHEWEQI